jgi:hypothetical protein
MTALGLMIMQRLVESRPAKVLRRFRSGCRRGPAFLFRAALGRGRRVIRHLDRQTLVLLMEIVARVTERKLLALVERPTPGVAADDQVSSSSKSSSQ